MVLDVTGNETIANLKKKIFENAEKLDNNGEIKIVLVGAILDNDNKTLTQCGVTNNAILHVLYTPPKTDILSGIRSKKLSQRRQFNDLNKQNNNRNANKQEKWRM